MGKLINGINGPFRGKVGPTIGYVVNGVGYIKGMYKLRTKPPTEKEALNQRKFAVAQHWLGPLRSFVKVGFKGYAATFQGFAAAKSWLMKNAMKLVDGEYVVDPSLVKVSSGTLPLPENLTCVQENSRSLRISWTRNDNFGNRYDQIMIACYDIANKWPDGELYGNHRYSGTHTFTFSGFTEWNIHLYVGFIADDRSRQSESIYLGEFHIGPPE